MKTTRSLRGADAVLEVDLVRRSSSMMPDLDRVRRAGRAASSTRPKSSSAKATSSGPCIFGLTM